MFTWKGQTYEGDHEPLISMGLYERTQEAFRKDGKPSKRQSHEFAYAGLLTCTHCGCAIVAERKQGRYVYYHCTGGRGGCARPYIREERLEELFAEVVEAVVITPETVEWIREALHESHRDEQTYHEEQIAELERRCAAVRRKLDVAYEDRLDRRIPEDLWQRKSREWREQIVHLRAAIERHDRASLAYFDQGFIILGPATRAHELWQQQEAQERRKLLEILLSNCSFDGEKLRATYRKPFCWLVEGRLCSDWLPGPDSNQQPTG